MNAKMSPGDTTVIAANRSKLMKLAENIKGKKKPGHNKKLLNFKKDPGYTNIEHLVFGTYRQKNSPCGVVVGGGGRGDDHPVSPSGGQSDHQQQQRINESFVPDTCGNGQNGSVSPVFPVRQNGRREQREIQLETQRGSLSSRGSATSAGSSGLIPPTESTRTSVSSGSGSGSLSKPLESCPPPPVSDPRSPTSISHHMVPLCCSPNFSPDFNRKRDVNGGTNYSPNQVGGLIDFPDHSDDNRLLDVYSYGDGLSSPPPSSTPTDQPPTVYGDTNDVHGDCRSVVTTNRTLSQNSINNNHNSRCPPPQGDCYTLNSIPGKILRAEHLLVATSSTVHSPPVHLTVHHNKFVTREFSADFASPDPPASNIPVHDNINGVTSPVHVGQRRSLVGIRDSSRDRVSYYSERHASPDHHDELKGDVNNQSSVIGPYLHHKQLPNFFPNSAPSPPPLEPPTDTCPANISVPTRMPPTVSSRASVRSHNRDSIKKSSLIKGTAQPPVCASWQTQPPQPVRHGGKPGFMPRSSFQTGKQITKDGGVSTTNGASDTRNADRSHTGDQRRNVTSYDNGSFDSNNEHFCPADRPASVGSNRLTHATASRNGSPSPTNSGLEQRPIGTQSSRKVSGNSNNTSSKGTFAVPLTLTKRSTTSATTKSFNPGHNAPSPPRTVPITANRDSNRDSNRLNTRNGIPATATNSFRQPPIMNGPCANRRVSVRSNGAATDESGVTTSIQALNKVSVTTANPSHPTLSTKLKIIVKSESPDPHRHQPSPSPQPTGPNTTIKGNVNANGNRASFSSNQNVKGNLSLAATRNRPNSGSQSSLYGSRGSLHLGQTAAMSYSRPASRLLANVQKTDGSLRLSAAANAALRNERARALSGSARPGGITAPPGNLVTRGRCSSASSLNNARHMGSTNSLGGSQSSLHSVASAHHPGRWAAANSRGPATVNGTGTARRSFHVGGSQRPTVSSTNGARAGSPNPSRSPNRIQSNRESNRAPITTATTSRNSTVGLGRMSLRGNGNVTSGNNTTIRPPANGLTKGGSYANASETNFQSMPDRNGSGVVNGGSNGVVTTITTRPQPKFVSSRGNAAGSTRFIGGVSGRMNSTAPVDRNSVIAKSGRSIPPIVQSTDRGGNKRGKQMVVPPVQPVLNHANDVIVGSCTGAQLVMVADQILASTDELPVDTHLNGVEIGVVSGEAESESDAAQEVAMLTALTELDNMASSLMALSMSDECGDATLVWDSPVASTTEQPSRTISSHPSVIDEVLEQFSELSNAIELADSVDRARDSAKVPKRSSGHRHLTFHGSTVHSPGRRLPTLTADGTPAIIRSSSARFSSTGSEDRLRRPLDLPSQEFGAHRTEGARSPPPHHDADRRSGAAPAEVEHLSLRDDDDDHDHDHATVKTVVTGDSSGDAGLQRQASGCATEVELPDRTPPPSHEPLLIRVEGRVDADPPAADTHQQSDSSVPPPAIITQHPAIHHSGILIQHQYGTPAAKSTSLHLHPHGERTVPKCVRRVKAASSPGFGDGHDAWVSESDLLRRPWSQICSDRDAERLAVQTAKGGSGSMVAGMDATVDMNPSVSAAPSGGLTSKPPSGANARGSSPQPGTANNIFSRFSSMRTPTVKLPDSPTHVAAAAAASEGVLQKFRKSFSARFYKKAAAKESSPPTSSTTSSSSSLKPLRHASWTTYLDQNGDSEDVTSSDPCLGGGGGGGSLLNTSSVSSETSGASVDGGQNESSSVGTVETVFRLGPIVWRSSKERKEKSRQNKKEASARRAGGGAEDRPDSAEVGGVEMDTKSEISTETSVNVTPASQRSISHPGPGSATPIAHVLRRRAQSTSLRSERPKRPLSDQGGTIHGSIILPNGLKMLKSGDYDIDDYRANPHIVRKGSAGPSLCPSIGSTGLPPFVVIKRDRRMPGLRWSRGKTNLRRSVSQPLEMEKMDGGSRASQGGLSDQEDHGHDISSASSQEEIPSDSENGGSTTRGLHKCNSNTSGEDEQFAEPVVYAEALWDHVTMDHEELAFKAGELVAVLDDIDSEWWWGVVGCRSGWFPASFVRARVNQEGSGDECSAEMKDGTLGSRKMSVSLLNTDQVRTNVIMEIISTERDFVRHLRDVCEGYLKQVRKRLDMFPEESVGTIFGNIEQLYAFQSGFVSKLEQCINWEQPHLSQIGTCFTEHKEGFEIYSEYCNNHPQAVNELQQLFANPKYSHFFEACRLLQDMIDISLDGFLLTPVQKICKYPLQLGELLKYTKPEHPDYVHVARALETMRSVAHYINERKRRMECLEKLAAWQMSVEYWEGPDLLDNCSELIHSGDVYKVTASWSRDFTLFLFDHQLIICKKDLLKRNTYSYKGRVDMDNCQIRDIPDGKDPNSGLTLKNSWKLYCSERDKWLVFATRTAEEKERWIKAFDDERWRVDEDKAKCFVVTEKAKKMALMVVLNRKKPKRPKEKENKNLGRRLTRPELYVVSSKSGSLPSNLVLSTANKKKTSSGWFHFGSNKKTKR